jgi:hypothetical protein
MRPGISLWGRRAFLDGPQSGHKKNEPTTQASASILKTLLDLNNRRCGRVLRRRFFGAGPHRAAGRISSAPFLFSCREVSFPLRLRPQKLSPFASTCIYFSVRAGIPQIL